MENQQQQQLDPTLGIVNVESITEGIQNLQMILEESRIILQPYMKLLLEEDDEDEDIHQQQHTTAEVEMYNDINTVQIFIECIDKSFSCVDMLLVRLADSGLIPVNTNSNNKQQEENVYLLMATNIICKANEFICHHCLSILEGDSLEDGKVGPLDDNDNQHNSSTNDIRIQPLMARMSELALRICHIQSTLVPTGTETNSDEDEDDDDEAITAQTIIEAYSQYQRRCLRSRSKPAISSIAELRSAASSQGCFVSDLIEAERRRQQLEEQVGGDNDDENDENDNEDSATRRQPHAEALTVVLGEASSLLQPLAAWRDALAPQTEQENDVCSILQQLCQESIELLDNEAQSLASTVGSWFTSDQRGVSTLDNNQNNSTTTTSSKSDLLSIESSLEEMAFICQVISRYCLFSEQILDTQDKKNNKLQDLLTEQSLHYSTLETRLATLQFNQALSLASPQLIELGRPSLQVPSIVEDAHFVCVRAIERASGTRSERAVWTVGHWVCEVWGIDNQSSSGGMMMGGNGDEKGIKGVYRALMEGVGCTSDENNNSNDENTTNGVDDITKSSPYKVENAFAAALMEDLDDGKEQANGSSNNNPGSTTNSAPSSGSLFFGRGGPKQSLQSRIDAEFCALNGISAAETACSALSGLFADLVDEKLQEESTVDESSAKMLTFARDELASHARSYKKLLQQRVRTVVADLCGGDDIFDCDGQLCLQNLRLFVEKEVYNLDGSAFRSLESEDRLETEMIKPIRQSQIYDEIGKDKCETSVVLQIAETMSWKSAEIILQVLLQGKTTFNEWGALLLSKQVRMLQNVYCGLVLQTSSSSSSSSSTATILTQFERVNQAVSILQLEKPSDWLAFSYKVGESNETNLTREEIEKIMSLRSDFSEEAIARVCVQIGGATTDS